MTVMPNVRVYPECGECQAPYILRRTFVLPLGDNAKGSGTRWVWQRDCKHEHAAPIVRQAPKKSKRGTP